MEPVWIDARQFEASLRALSAACERPEAGFFGPQSMVWRMSRESALFAGSWRAALLQLAHPWVARAIEEHSRTLHDPVGRFHGTFRILFTLIFGNRDQALASARGLHRLHHGIRGVVRDVREPFPPGRSYAANEEQAMIWVLLTLWDTSLLAYESLVAPLSLDERERFYAESRRLAQLFGIRPSVLPDSWTAAKRAFRSLLRSPVIQGDPETTRRLARMLLRRGLLPFDRHWLPSAESLTAEWMPEPLRNQLGLPASSPAEDARARRILAALRRGYRLLPDRVRFVPPYFEAQERLRGSRRGTPLTRLGNRLWLGQPGLVGRDCDPSSKGKEAARPTPSP